VAGQVLVRRKDLAVLVARSVALFALAALFEIGGAWLVWQGLREHRGWAWVGAGVVALGLYGAVATWQSDDNFGRVLAAYGGIFVAGSIAWGVVADGYRPDRFDVLGALICLAATRLKAYAMATPSPIRVNMFGFRVTTEFQPRTKNGQPAQSTTGVARPSSSHFRSSGGSTLSGETAGTMPPIVI